MRERSLKWLVILQGLLATALLQVSVSLRMTRSILRAVLRFPAGWVFFLCLCSA